MASNLETDYDSDTEIVPDFDIVDMENFKLVKGEQLIGGSWETIITHVKNPNITLKFALPPVKVDSDGLDIQNASKNGFYRITLNDNDEKHVEFKRFISELEKWLVDSIVNNHNEWFGHMWNKDGPFANMSRPPQNVIKDMYHPIIDEDNIMCSRVHIRKDQYEIQCMDSDMNNITLQSIKNCYVVPLVELKGIFMKPKGYNPDIVLRGLVAINDTDQDAIDNTDYCLFHTQTDDSDAMKYYDYATEDEDTSSESGDDDIELNNVQEVAQEVVQQNVQQNVQENVQETAQETAQETTQEDVKKNVEENVQQIVGGNVQQNVQQNVQENVQENVQQNVQQNVQEEIAQENVQETTQENVQEKSNNFRKEKLEELMRTIEQAKTAAKQAENTYRRFIASEQS